MEKRLSFTIGTMLETTDTAHLAGVTRVNTHNLTAMPLCLVFNHSPQTGKAPLVHLAFQASAFTGFHPSANFRQILNHNNTAGRNALNDALTHHMVTVRAKTGQAITKLFQATLGALCSFALQAALALKVSAFNVLPTAFAKEAVIVGNGGSRDAEINSDNFTRHSRFQFRQRQNNVQKEVPIALKQIGTIKATGFFELLLCVGITHKLHFLPFVNRCQRNRRAVRHHAVGSGIVANRARTALWLRNLLAFLHQSQRRSNGFGSFDARGYNQLGRQLRKLLPQRVVGFFVQCDAILLFVLPSVRRNRIEAFRMLTQCFAQQLGLLWCRLKSKTDGALHMLSFSYVKRLRNLQGSLVSGETNLNSSHDHKGRGFLEVCL
jgi:hypothetical protein